MDEGRDHAAPGADRASDRVADRGADRQDAILDAAFHAFATYGFRRATMDDIARGAGMSRPALYLHYRNKEDIFRSLAERYFEEAMRNMAAALATPGLTPEAQLIAAFIAKDGKFMEAVLGTPHGADLLDAGFQVSGDIARAADTQMLALLAGWVSRQTPGDLGTPDEVAQLLLAGLYGLKTSCTTLADYRAGQARLARVFARALRGSGPALTPD